MAGLLHMLPATYSSTVRWETDCRTAHATKCAYVLVLQPPGSGPDLLHHHHTVRVWHPQTVDELLVGHALPVLGQGKAI